MMFPFPFVPPVASSAPTSMAFHDVAYSDNDTVTVPTPQAGDVMVLAQYSSGASLPTLVTPGGFTGWINISAATTRVAVSYGIATGSETSVVGMDGSDFDDKILAVFRPDVPVSVITASTPVTQTTTGNPTAQNINADGAGTLPLIAFGFYATTTFSGVDPRTMSPAATGELNNSGSALPLVHWMKYQLQNAALADVSVDMDDEGSNNLLASGFLWFS